MVSESLLRVEKEWRILVYKRFNKAALSAGIKDSHPSVTKFLDDIDV